jgi:hypothetical protein
MRADRIKELEPVVPLRVLQNQAHAGMRRAGWPEDQRVLTPADQEVPAVRAPRPLSTLPQDSSEVSAVQ